MKTKKQKQRHVVITDNTPGGFVIRLFENQVEVSQHATDHLVLAITYMEAWVLGIAQVKAKTPRRKREPR